jgi:hypothetical protein
MTTSKDRTKTTPEAGPYHNRSHDFERVDYFVTHYGKAPASGVNLGYRLDRNGDKLCESIILWIEYNLSRFLNYTFQEYGLRLRPRIGPRLLPRPGPDHIVDYFVRC